MRLQCCLEAACVVFCLLVTIFWLKMIDDAYVCARKYERSIHGITTGCLVKYKHRWVSEEEYQRLVEREGT